MDAYLVMLRHGMDDIPMLLTAVESEAIEFAERLGPNSGEREKIELGIDASMPNCVDVYRFVGGKLCGMNRIKTFDG